MIGDILHQLNADDLQKTFLQAVTHQFTQAGAAVTVRAHLRVPDGFSFLWGWVRARSSPGAAQTTSLLTIGVLHEVAGAEVNIAQIASGSFVNYGAAGAFIDYWTPLSNIVIPERDIIYAQGNYSAAGNPNNTTLVVVGHLIPMGNMALGGMEQF